MRQGKSSQHVLERRAGLLAQKLQVRIGDMSTALKAADGRVPFKTKLSQGNALDWWSKHRYDGMGQRAMQSLDPMSIVKLDAALANYNNLKNQQGLPDIQDTGANTGIDPNIATLAAGNQNGTSQF